MATVKSGKVGRFNGKIGDVVIYKREGKLLGRDVPSKSSKAPTLAQLTQQVKFSLVNSFAGNISDILTIGYQHSRANGMTAMNAAVSYHLNNAVTGVYPDFQLDYSKVRVSDAKGKGEIDGGYASSLLPAADAKVTVSWIVQDPAGIPATAPADLVYLVFYNITKERFVTFQKKAARSLLTTTAQIPRSFIGDSFHGYLFFVSEDGKSVSDSEDLGPFTVIA